MNNNLTALDDESLIVALRQLPEWSQLPDHIRNNILQAARKQAEINARDYARQQNEDATRSQVAQTIQTDNISE